MTPISRADDPASWSEHVDRDEPVIIQVDDGNLRDGKGIVPTSSSSAPEVMAEMVDLLDLKPGMNVLEIGTGTGYNAALIAERVTPGSVTTVEIDPSIADHARQSLRRAGLPVTVITGNGSDGYADNAEYDRVTATASLRTVPKTWIAQARVGGLLVLPFSGSFNRGAFLRLSVDSPGVASGHFHGTASFMRLRDQRPPKAVWWDSYDQLRVTTTDVNSREPFDRYEAGFALGLVCPGLVTGKRTEPDGEQFLRLSDAESGSWASFAGTPDDGRYEVAQHGPRNLWDELESAYQWWTQAGRPEHTRFGLTVTPDAQTVWLDTPSNPVPSFGPFSL